MIGPGPKGWPRPGNDSGRPSAQAGPLTLAALADNLPPAGANVGNLLNKKWGRTDEVGFNGLTGEGGATTRDFVVYKGLASAGK